MKSSIHPTYYQDAKVTCACGNTFVTGSTLKEIHVDICSACPPFYTGEMRLIDTQGRIEKFEAKRQHAAKTPAKKKKSKTSTKDDRPRTLKEMLKKEPTEKQAEPTKQKSSKQKNKNLLSDPELKDLAKDEIHELEEQKKALLLAQDSSQNQSFGKKTETDQPSFANCIIEIRAAAGGDEAKIWAADFLRM